MVKFLQKRYVSRSIDVPVQGFSTRFAHDKRYVLRSPGTAGDPRFDALIAGAAEREARSAGVRVPLWTSNDASVLPEAWFVTEFPGFGR